MCFECEGALRSVQGYITVFGLLGFINNIKPSKSFPCEYVEGLLPCAVFHAGNNTHPVFNKSVSMRAVAAGLRYDVTEKHSHVFASF